MVDDWKRRLQSITVPSQGDHVCGCIGPQNGEPLCPCRMRCVTIKDGRYVEVIDHGPVPSDKKPVSGVWACECPKCGLKLAEVMGYVCTRQGCPCGLGSFS